MKNVLLLLGLLSSPAFLVAEVGRSIPTSSDTGTPEDLERDLRRLSENVTPRTGGDLILYKDTKNERVGVGTITPACKFDVSGEGCFSGITMSGNIAMGGNRITGLGPSESDGQALRYQDVYPLIYIRDGTLSPSVASGILTVSLKTNGGSDPSSSSPVQVLTRNVTASSGPYTSLSVTSSLSVALSSGSTAGTSNSTAFKLWVVLFNDGGTTRMGLINCSTGTNVYALGRIPLASSTAEGGAGASDSSAVFYTGSAVSSKAFAILGYLSYESGLAQAGNWTATPTRVQMFIPGVPLPGEVVGVSYTQTGAVATGSTVVPNDDTIPQSGEGDEYMTLAYTPTSAAHLLRISAQGYFASDNDIKMGMALFQDSTAGALSASDFTSSAANVVTGSPVLVHQMRAGTTSSTTFKIRCGALSASTVTFNGSGGGRKFGGVMNSYMRVEEIAT